ncbi:MAG: ADP-ribosylglycohydrolase family protein [Bacteroidales bacterium]|nr:ADP-ribosylglycohydrolase family protein [Bacteroidales bacterium]
MLGAITGDMIGSVYEFENTRKIDFPLFQEDSGFTDDSVLTVATMENLLSGKSNYTFYYQTYARKYPDRGYGGRFRLWMYSENPRPYNSFGNGSAMRVSPVGWFFSTLEETLTEAECSAIVTHNHPEGIKGAQAIAAAIFLARTGKSKAEIKHFIETKYAYDLNRTCNEIRPDYQFNETCQGSVPEAIIAFMESTDFEHAIRLAISLGGDSDTIAAITGGIAEAFYGKIPENIAKEVEKRLPNEWIPIVKKFSAVVGESQL